jgi:hypothetical protein
VAQPVMSPPSRSATCESTTPVISVISKALRIGKSAKNAGAWEQAGCYRLKGYRNNPREPLNKLADSCTVSAAEQGMER